METKICNKCGKEKLLSDFHKDKNYKGGHKSTCKECIKIKSRERYVKKRDILAEKSKIYYINNIDKRKEYGKKWRIKNDAIIKQKKRYYYENNKEKRKKKQKEWKINNRQKRIETDKKYRKKRLEEDYLFKLKERTRYILYISFKNKKYSKKSKSQEILGCSWDFFKSYIEAQFDESMSWDNYGSYWHIDHIIPMKEANTEEDVMRLNYYTNLRPLEGIENIVKGGHRPKEDYQYKLM